MLAYPDFTRPFKLITDASKVGLGATLTLGQGNGEHPISYASEANSNARQLQRPTWSARWWCVRSNCSDHITTGKSKLVTAHAVLKWLMTSKDLTGGLHRWSMQLQEYYFDVVY